MLFEDTYKTIKAPAEGLFKDRGSKFLAYAYPIESEEEVKEFRKKILKIFLANLCLPTPLKQH